MEQISLLKEKKEAPYPANLLWARGLLGRLGDAPAAEFEQSWGEKSSIATSPSTRRCGFMQGDGCQEGSK